MKKILMLIILVSFLGCSGSTNNDDSKYKEATITGADYRKCMCCGGWLIDIDTLHFNFNNLPDGSQINLEQEKFPLPVLVQYNTRTEGCANIIDITHIKKR
jgi:hypothetical protein